MILNTGFAVAIRLLTLTCGNPQLLGPPSEPLDDSSLGVEGLHAVDLGSRFCQESPRQQRRGRDQIQRAAGRRQVCPSSETVPSTNDAADSDSAHETRDANDASPHFMQHSLSSLQHSFPHIPASAPSSVAAAAVSSPLQIPVQSYRPERGYRPACKEHDFAMQEQRLGRTPARALTSKLSSFNPSGAMSYSSVMARMVAS